VQHTAPLAEILAAAARVVAQVLAGRSLDAALAEEERGELARAPAVRDAAYGTLRDYGAPDAIVAALVRRNAPDRLVRALLLCALHELRRARRAPYVVVDQAVAACAPLGCASARGFVNACLRNYLRRREALDADALRAEPARYRYPQWWIDRVRAAHPAAWQSVLAAGNTHPPMTLRVNRRRTTVDQYLGMLAAGGIGAHRIGESGVRVAAPRPVYALPGFADGLVSVQDAGAQAAAPLLDVHDGLRVLDACAAPGGKTAHLLELANLDLVAIDRDAARCARIDANLARLGLAAEVRAADAAAIDAWWDGRPFERILLDAPCTASGVVRRHPDIKWLRRATDSAGFALEQARLLGALWRVLAPGGTLLYATCSVFPDENDAVVSAFAARAPEARRVELPGRADGQLLPDEDGDGFFYALLRKSS
jgi:16S rRNA (cytosine967-C5)-methyltransferase